MIRNNNGNKNAKQIAKKGPPRLPSKSQRRAATETAEETPLSSCGNDARKSNKTLQSRKYSKATATPRTTTTSSDYYGGDDNYCFELGPAKRGESVESRAENEEAAEMAKSDANGNKGGDDMLENPDDISSSEASVEPAEIVEPEVTTASESKRKKLHLTLENFDRDDVPEDCPYVLTSPRSLEACKRLRVKVRPCSLSYFDIHVII